MNSFLYRSFRGKKERYRAWKRLFLGFYSIGINRLAWSDPGTPGLFVPLEKNSVAPVAEILPGARIRISLIPKNLPRYLIKEVSISVGPCSVGNP